jgi:prepilin-type N-terminal cleavage/methylation domain-containing protein
MIWGGVNQPLDARSFDVRRSRREVGFTLVEVLTAVAIIAVLVALVFLAFKHVGGSAKRNRTAVSLQNLKNMLTEFEHSGGRMGQIEYADAAGAPNGVYGDLYWDSAKKLGKPLPLDSTSSGVSEGAAGRFGEYTIRTQRVMRRLLSTPAIKKTFDGLPKDSLLYVQYQSGVKYVVGDEVVVPRGKDQYDYYVCNIAPATAAPPGMGWGATDHHTPVVADGYGNPIWFIPRGGVSGVNLVATGNTSKPYSNPNELIVAPGAVPNPTPPPTKIGMRPFFASAGEDGDFSKGDDNQYSFDQ